MTQTLMRVYACRQRPPTGRCAHVSVCPNICTRSFPPSRNTPRHETRERALLKLLQEVTAAAAKLIYPSKQEELLARAGKRRRTQSAKAIDSALIKTAVEM
jgi:hypothetical protein